MNRLRIGAIGTEIGAGYAARKCEDYGRKRGGVVVMVDACGVCWAFTAGSVPAAQAIERQTSSIVGTFIPGVLDRREVIDEILAGIRERMLELGAEELAA